MNQHLLVVLLLGFSSGLPLGLLTSTLQAWYSANHLSVMTIGALSLIGLPYACRTLWGPVVDKYSLNALGKRRSWILTTQMMLLIGFNLMAWCTPAQYPLLLAFFALFLACLSATQDMVIDAHRIEYLPLKEHALGASYAAFGYRIALLLSGGLALIIAVHLGWGATYRIIGAFMVVGMLAVLCSKEPATLPNYDNRLTLIAPIKELLLRPKSGLLILFIFCYPLGQVFTAANSGIVMPFFIQGLGFSLTTIGYINKMLGVGAALIGGVLSGLILMRYSLYNSLLLFGLLQALTNVLFVFLAWVGKNTYLLAMAVTAGNIAEGMSATALVALFMRLVNRKFTGTQFSLLVALSIVSRIISGPLAALLQMKFGWVGLYHFSIVLALVYIPFLIAIKETVKATEISLIETTLGAVK